MNNTDIEHLLLGIFPSHRIHKDAPLKHHTHTKMGGNADFLVFPNTYDEVIQTVRMATGHHIPYTVLGNGSNLIIRDGGIRGVVLNLTELNQISSTGTEVVAQCGATIIDVSRYALSKSLTGLEFACGIPGTVGGAVYMNAGAYGGEVKQVCNSVRVITPTGDVLTLPGDDLGFEYRSSLVAKRGYIVLEATFALENGHYEAIQAKMDDLTFQRESKQPLEYPSCGSVFKRPPNLFAGKLIQDAGLQGTQIGGAQVSTKHAGFIVNIDNATASEYIALIKHVQGKVKERFGVDLETEVRIIGEELK